MANDERDDPGEPMSKDKTTAGVLGILLGTFGAHKFYLGETGKGLLYLLFCWTYIPAIVGLVEGIQYLSMDQDEFQHQYGQQLPDSQIGTDRQLAEPRSSQSSSSPPQKRGHEGTDEPEMNHQIAQNVTVNVADDETSTDASDDSNEQLGVAEEIEKLEELRRSGAISDEEFERQKKKLLS